MLLDDLLHLEDHTLPDLGVLLGDAVLPGCLEDGCIHCPQLASRGRRQGTQLVLLLLFLRDTAEARMEKRANKKNSGYIPSKDKPQSAIP